MPGEANPNVVVVPGEPDTLKGVAHTQIVGIEPDLTRGEVADPRMGACAHPEGAEPETLMEAGVDWSLEEGTAREHTSIEEDKDPRIKLQEPGISHLQRWRMQSSLPRHDDDHPSPPRLLGRSAPSRQRRDAGNPNTRSRYGFGAAAA